MKNNEKLNIVNSFKNDIYTAKLVSFDNKDYDMTVFMFDNEIDEDGLPNAPVILDYIYGSYKDIDEAIEAGYDLVYDALARLNLITK